MTDEYRCDDYELHAEPVVTEAGVAAPSETVEHRSDDHDELLATSSSTVTEPETKVVKPADPGVGTK